LDKVEEVVRGFFEEVFKAVSYVVATVIILTALETQETSEVGWTVYGGAVSSMRGSSSKSWDEEATVVLASRGSLF